MGIDFSSEAVNLCSQWYGEQDNLSFVEGNAEDLPFDDESFDLVYNVESSHCYGDMGAFIEQVHRVLRKGGTFCWTDLRDAETMSLIHLDVRDHEDLRLLNRRLWSMVLRALDEIIEAKIEQITKQGPQVHKKERENFRGGQRDSGVRRIRQWLDDVSQTHDERK